MKSQKIETIRKRYPKEWLLIAVDKVDASTTRAISGRLVAHSPSRDDIYTKSFSPCKGLIFITYADQKIPKGYAAAF